MGRPFLDLFSLATSYHLNWPQEQEDFSFQDDLSVIKAQRVAVLDGRLPPLRRPLHWFGCVRVLKEPPPETTTTATASGSGRTTSCGEITAGGGASSAAQYRRTVVGLKLQVGRLCRAAIISVCGGGVSGASCACVCSNTPITTRRRFVL